ncbi:uncharacterized protein MONBRDRAFT_38210 [Monosiga brevicollis MX1]|uniref:Uncharacterized protein n=1 Tax=Monosiga brevicollis TaxID=81824 RepID=A9V6B4_MONBE|nr:uncharacterized protein MONBRDRAFT_38210 [Monosiga brevicollis MX1]EDQ86962.1 predicted protein [Monosiga brevicollis MX1]|eukprot:XP_001748201.1 hypothetical protein [Monosiga brevicollis MX1]
MLWAAPPSRLLAMLQHALKWQAYTGSLPAQGDAPIDIFRNKVDDVALEDELPPSKLGRTIKDNFMLMNSAVTVLTFSRDSEMLASGDKEGQIKMLVCVRSKHLYVINPGGQVVQTFSKDPKSSGDFIYAIPSPRGAYIYAIGEDRILYCFSTETGELEHSFEAHEREPLGLVHHPHHNVLATYADDGRLRVWKS